MKKVYHAHMAAAHGLAVAFHMGRASLYRNEGNHERVKHHKKVALAHRKLSDKHWHLAGRRLAKYAHLRTQRLLDKHGMKHNTMPKFKEYKGKK